MGPQESCEWAGLELNDHRQTAPDQRHSSRAEAQEGVRVSTRRRHPGPEATVTNKVEIAPPAPVVGRRSRLQGCGSGRRKKENPRCLPGRTAGARRKNPARQGMTFIVQ